MTVEVTPRLGLFSVLTYEKQEQFEQSIKGGPMGRIGFDRESGRLVERTRPDALSYLPQRWQWIPEPVVSPFKASPKPDFEGALKSRQVVVSVAASKCEWHQRPGGAPAEGCAFEFSLESNLSARLAGRADGREIRFGIPADILVVSVGDSYASGEGNPDRPILSKSDSDERPIGLSKPAWMDQRCHRSLWSGPAQTVLRLSRANCSVSGGKGGFEALAGIPRGTPCEAPEASDNLALSYRGNYSFVSLACSGGEIKEGVLAEYGGRQRIADMRRLLRDMSARGDESALPLLRLGNAAAPYELRRLPPQINRLASVLNIHGGGARHLVMSIGGNDINFGGILTDYLASAYPACDDADCKKDICEHPLHGQSIFCQYDRVAAGDLKLLSDRLYPELAERLSAFGLPNVRTVYLTQYPDPMRCEDGSFCSGTNFLGLGPFEAIAAGFGAGLDVKKGEHAVAKVVTPLNRTVASESRSRGWALVGGLQDKFRSNGWCTAGGLDQYDPAMLRNFRTLADSVAVQGSLTGDYFFSTGAMHPNFLGHARIADQILGAILKEPLVAAADLVIGERLEGDYVGGSFKIALPQTAHERVDPIIEIDVAASAVCAGRQCSVTDAGAGRRSLVVRGRDIEGKWFEAPRSVIVDTAGPEIRVAPQPDENSWLVDPRPLRLALTARDAELPSSGTRAPIPGSGFARWTQCDLTNLADDKGKLPCPGFGPTRNVDVLELEISGDGDFVLLAAAEDRVGNSSTAAPGRSAGHAARIRRDATPPSAELSVGGIALGSSPLMVVNSSRPAVELRASDQTSGVSELVFSWGERSRKILICKDNCPRGTVRSVIELDGLAERTPLSAALQVKDVAGLASRPQPFTIVYARSKSTRRSAAAWQERRDQAAQLLPLIARWSVRLAGRAALPPAADADWPLLAAWLNLLDGRVAAGEPVSYAQPRACLGGQRTLAAGPQPALKVLEFADACWSETPAAVEDLVRQLLPNRAAPGA